MHKLQSLVNSHDIKKELKKLSAQGFGGFEHIEESSDAYYFTLPICEGFKKNPTLVLMLDLDESINNQLQAWCAIDTHETGIEINGIDYELFVSSSDEISFDNIISNAYKAIVSSYYSKDAVRVKGKFQYRQMQKFAEAVIPILELVKAKSNGLAA